MSGGCPKCAHGVARVDAERLALVCDRCGFALFACKLCGGLFCTGNCQAHADDVHRFARLVDTTRISTLPEKRERTARERDELALLWVAAALVLALVALKVFG